MEEQKKDSSSENKDMSHDKDRPETSAGGENTPTEKQSAKEPPTGDGPEGGKDEQEAPRTAPTEETPQEIKGQEDRGANKSAKVKPEEVKGRSGDAKGSGDESSLQSPVQKGSERRSKPKNCEFGGCKKILRQKAWYYREDKFYCSKRCWRNSAKADAGQEAEKPA